MKTKFVRVGRSGSTVDGRRISAEMIDQAASAYDPAVYQARINLEHFRGLFPDGPFRMYGDVLALKSEADGDERVLLAALDITEDLGGLLAKRQKTHWSMELAENFAGTGGAYLVGLAVTDSPASLATEALTFATGRQPMLYGAVFEAGALEAAPARNTGQAPAGPAGEPASGLTGGSLLDQLSALLGRRDKTGPADAPATVDATADRIGPLEAAALRLAEDAAVRQRDIADLDARIATLTGAIDRIAAAHTALTGALSRQPATPARPAVSGAAANRTDI